MENEIIFPRYVWLQFFTTPCYIGPVCQIHDNRVKTAEVTGSRIFPPKNVVTMATITPPTPKMQRHLISVLCAKFHANRVKTAEAKGK